MPIITFDTPPTLGELASLVGGELHGQAQTPVLGLCPLNEPQQGHLAFASKINKALHDSIPELEQLAGLLVPVSDPIPDWLAPIDCIRVENPQAELLRIIPTFFKARAPEVGIHETAVIDETATLGKNVSVGPFCVIGTDVRIGDNTVLHPHVTIYAGARIGDNCVLHSGCHIREDITIKNHCIIQNGSVIGGEGFGYMPDPEVGLRLVPQIGTVEIESHVEVGANSCIDRAALGSTRIGTGTKLDNLVQVGHNCQVGNHVLLCALVGIGGSTKLGNQVVMGGMSGAADHMNVVDGVRVAGKGGVIFDINESGDYAGMPAIPAQTWRRQNVLLQKLPKMFKKLRKVPDEK